MTSRLIISTTLLLHFSVCSAQLQPMDDGDLEAVSGQLGIVFDGLKLVADPDANLHLSFDTGDAYSGAALDNVSIVGAGSCDAWVGGSVSLGSCGGFTVGTASDPIEFNVSTASGATYMELVLPGGVTGPSEAGSGGNFAFDYAGWGGDGMDISTRLVVYGEGYDKNNSGGFDGNEQSLIFADTVWIQAKEVRLPGTSLRVWSNNTNILQGANGSDLVNDGDDIGASFALNVNGTIDELKMDFANSRSYNAAAQSYQAFAPHSTGDGPRSGSGFGDAMDPLDGSDGSVQGLITLGDIRVANLSLGVFPYMPLHFGSTDGDGDGPGFFVEIPLLAESQADSFYANVPKADIYIGRFELGSYGSGTGSIPNPGGLGVPAGTGANFIPTETGYSIGSAQITGIRIQHLRIELGG